MPDMTVVGYFPDEGDSYVEHVVADTPEEAAEAASNMDKAREDAVVVAVFTGHLIDLNFSGPYSCTRKGRS